MRELVFIFIAMLSAIPAFPQTKELKLFQVYEPAYIDSDSMLKYEGKLARCEKGWLYTKEALSRNASWKKTRKIKNEDFLVRIYNGASASLHEIPEIKNVFINKSGTLAAFTASFGGSPNTSAGLIDLEKNALVFTADLKIKPKGFGGPPQLAMEHTWFRPCITEDGKYMACDGFSGKGDRESAIMSIADKKIERLSMAAMPAINGGNVFFLEANAAKKINYLVMRPLSGGKEEKAGSYQGRAIGLEALAGKIYVITETKILLYDAGAGNGLKEIYDFSYLSRGYEFMSVEKTFSGTSDRKNYVFLAVKRLKAGKYEWGLFGLETE